MEFSDITQVKMKINNSMSLSHMIDIIPVTYFKMIGCNYKFHDHIWWSYLISFLLAIIKQSKKKLLKKLILFNFVKLYFDKVSE